VLASIIAKTVRTKNKNSTYGFCDYKSFSWQDGTIIIKRGIQIDKIAQIIADFLRKRLLIMGKKFSFETVFSHAGKLEFMKEAVDAGYKVYLYFVCTESPEINKFRVKKVRVKEGGHDVPEDKIESRYYRSLELLFDAAQISYQTFFFDNSGSEFNLFAHFKKERGKKKWNIPNRRNIPQWFLKYYSSKVKRK
jgi:predicted ABC-type ATPase